MSVIELLAGCRYDEGSRQPLACRDQMPAASAVVAAILAFIVTGVAVKNIYEPTVIAAKKKEDEENKGK